MLYKKWDEFGNRQLIDIQYKRNTLKMIKTLSIIVNVFGLSPLGLTETKYFAITLKHTLKFGERNFSKIIATYYSILGHIVK